MDATEHALAAVRQEWLAQGSPSIPQLAQRANMPSITARRYLDGSTKHGDPAKIRALAIALGRSDIADTVRDTVTGELSDSIMKFMTEKFLLWRESNLEELEHERILREESEKRMLAEIERVTKSKDTSISMLLKRIEELERDKSQLSEDKGRIYTEMDTVRKAKRNYERLAVALLVLLALYFLIFDLPYPDSGVTELILNLLRRG